MLSLLEHDSYVVTWISQLSTNGYHNCDFIMVTHNIPYLNVGGLLFSNYLSIFINYHFLFIFLK